MRKTFLTAATVALVMVLPVAAMGGGDHGGEGSACSGFAEGSEIVMKDSCFDGVAHLAPIGSTIVVRNEGGLPHSLTAVDGSFNTGELAAGQTAELTIDEPGVYRVFCALHGTAEGDGMAGVLIAGEPEQLSITAPPSLHLLTQAVEEGNRDMAGALESQSAMLAAFTSSFAKMTEAMGEPASDPGPAAEESSMATPATPVVELKREAGWATALAAAALALGVAAVAIVLAGRRDPPGDQGQPVGMPQF